jgi:hypothetical protein
MMAIALILKDKVAFIAFTGVAASLIFGKTIHDLFHIKKMGSISSIQLNIVIKILSSLWLIVIDEKSFIGKKFWN